jgi:thiol-disulfide isomerase/thioredoxin
MKFIKTILLALLLALPFSSFGDTNIISRFEEDTPRQLPNIAFIDLKNNKTFLESFSGNVLLLHFWATWCSNCKDEMIKLDFFQKKVRDKPIIILPLSEDFKGTKIVEEFYKNNNITNLLSFIDRKNEIFAKMNISGLPTSIIIDSSGHEVARAIGTIDWGDDALIGYLMKFSASKPIANADYLNLMQKQYGDRLTNVEPKKIDAQEIIDEIIPQAAVTNLQPVEFDNEDPNKGYKASNIKTDKFSLKMKRPVNLENKVKNEN